MDPKRDEYVNYSTTGQEIKSGPTTDLATPDPPHEIPFVQLSLKGEKPDGFVLAYEKYYAEKGVTFTEQELRDIMGYTQKGFLPALHKMEDFASVCSQWYCSLRGPTWPNRMYALSGSCFGWRTTPEMNSSIVTDIKKFLKDWHDFKPIAPQKFSVHDVLDEAKATHHIYTDSPFDFSLAGDVFYSLLDDDMNRFRRHCKKGKLPNFSFIEPNYINMPALGLVQNDDHPPSNPIKAQKFIASVYNSLRDSPKWKNTLLVVTYDEHGGFFDPVVPPEAPIPDAVSNDEMKTFGKFGVRVPTACIKQGIDNTVYDHTSVLKYVLQKWAPEGIDKLGERVKHANTLPVLKTPRTDEFPSISKGDFKLLKDFWAANKPDQVKALDHKLSLHESAAVAIKDPEIEQTLRKAIIEKKLAKNASPDEALRLEAELYAQGADVDDEIGPMAEDILTYQIKAMTMYAEKAVGKNDLAKSFLQLMQVRAKDHAKKINTQKTKSKKKKNEAAQKQGTEIKNEGSDVQKEDSKETSENKEGEKI